MNSEYTTIGRSIPKIGVNERLRGEPIFGADIDFDDALVLKVLRSTKAHARILDINYDQALKLEGIVRVFTEKDIPGKNLLGIINKDQPLLADGKVRAIGEPVALVAAESEAAAHKALDFIEVTYEDLPAVLTPADALKPDAPKIHAKGNLLFTRKVKKGDVEQAFERCAFSVEKTYRTARIEHSYLEPDAGAGYVDENGVLVIYASTQNPHYDHKEVTGLLGLEDDRVRIVQAATGGGFGSKLDLNVQGFIGLAMLHLQRPVRMVYTREESFLATAKRHPVEMTLKTAVDENGKIIALQARITADTGAYGSYGIAVASRIAMHATGPYEVDNVDIESRCIYTNTPFCGAMRGFGTPQVAIAHESQMNLLAEKLGMDPLEFRLMNVLKNGSETATGQRLAHSVGIAETLEALIPHYEWAQANWLSEKVDPWQKRGIGLGSMWYGIGNTGVQNPSTAKIKIDLGGNITLYTGCADIGQGSTTVLAQIAAEILGVRPREIRLFVADTRCTTNAGATSASRQTYISGNAVKEAAEKLADVLLSEAVNKLKVAKSDLMLEGGFVRETANPENAVEFSFLAGRANQKGVPLKWQGYFDPETVPLDPETGQGVPYATYAYASQLALLTVDTLTGEVSVEKIFAAHDVGKAIHPENVKGQICGGVAMGVGFALMEEFTPGQTLSMKDYLIPTIADVPEIVPIIVESVEPSGPFGAKGVGEPALIPTAPSVLNALADALGQRIYELPANLERVLDASIRGGHFYKLKNEN
ncbi:aldehyde oxidase [Alkalispirochaeta odontotermitis]|nr:aldehyde oxidase [Alkalispirochaeta odontotermitis]CAB1077913.1 Xanthine dehydrogenase, molybdenum binding subunit (EC [Olavius algarvensis Delta 1 endosymbiont]